MRAMKNNISQIKEFQAFFTLIVISWLIIYTICSIPFDAFINFEKYNTDKDEFLLILTVIVLGWLFAVISTKSKVEIINGLNSIPEKILYTVIILPIKLIKKYWHYIVGIILLLIAVINYPPLFWLLVFMAWFGIIYKKIKSDKK